MQPDRSSATGLPKQRASLFTRIIRALLLALLVLVLLYGVFYGIAVHSHHTSTHSGAPATVAQLR